MKASKKYKKCHFRVTFKFGIKVPRTGDIRGARSFDKENRATHYGLMPNVMRPPRYGTWKHSSWCWRTLT
eukprot:4659025-Ditylum_brightwellii.AAC.1